MLGPLLFVLYMANLSSVADVHGIGSHFYADDTQRADVLTSTSGGSSGDAGDAAASPSARAKNLNDYILGIVEKRRIRSGFRLAS